MSFLPPRLLRLAAAVAVIVVLTRSPHTSSAASGLVMLSGFPNLKQQHSLTCESSVASMGTQGVITESQLMSVMPRSPNPNFGFRGNPDGFQGTQLVDYGVYAAPIQRALLHYGYDSDLLVYATRNDIKKNVDAGRPVVAWITYALQPAKPRLGAFNGVHFVLVPHEHAVLIIGYDAQTVIANDPWNGKQVRYYWDDFQRSWGLFGNMALAMNPCPTPSEVQRISVARINAARLTWKWSTAANAARYEVKVVRHGAKDVTVLNAIVTDHRISLQTPAPGASYEIVVRAIAACGVKSPPTRLWFDAPTVLPTIVPTPSATAIPVTPTASPTSTPAPVATPTTTH